MKKLLSILIAGALSALSATVISAVEVDDKLDSVTAESKVWSNAKYSEVLLYPQTTITFNDKEAVEENSARLAKRALIGAIYNKDKIAFNVKWADETKDMQKSNAIRAFGDGVALQIATDYADPSKLPYIGMGSEGRSVIVHLQKSADPLFEPNGGGDVYHQVNPKNVNQYDDELLKESDSLKSDGLTKFKEKADQKMKTSYARTFIAEGFRSTTEIKDGSASFDGDMYFDEPFLFGDNMWSATFTRSLQDSYLSLQGAFPVALAIWQGDKKNRDGLKHLSSWLTVELQEGTASKFETAFAPSKGDVEKGKELAKTNCAACHNYRENNLMPKFMAPNLSNIGGYSTAAYIKESMIKPSAVVVPGYNRNAHPNYAWYSVESNGKRTSTMPDYSWLSAEDIDSIVAYFATLKAEKKEK